MSITAERKQELIGEFATKSGDTGSPEVQGAILTERRFFRTGPPAAGAGARRRSNRGSAAPCR